MSVDWNAAQEMEAAAWRDGICASTASVIEELADAAGLDAFIRAGGVSYRRAVDVGIGPMGVGWVALFGIGAAEDLVGLDPLPRIAPSTGRPELDRFVLALQERITYAQGRAEDRVLPGASFDLVVCDNVVDHTQQPEDVMAECRRLVAPGGHLAFGVNVFSSVGYQKWNRYTRRRMPDNPTVIMHPHSYTERTAEELVTASGWRVLSRRAAPLHKRVAGRAYRYRVLARPEG